MRAFHVFVVGGVGVAFVMTALFLSDTCGASPSRGPIVVETNAPPAAAAPEQRKTAAPVDPNAPPRDSDPYRYFDPKKAIARFHFKDVDGDAEYDSVALDFSNWAEARLPWSYVSGPAETTTGKALKDIDAERGKRACWSGFVGEIKAAGGAFKGGLVAPDGKVVRFLAVHETGNVEQGTTARFCGIVTGTIKFANAEGTTTDAVQTVGMFDLPANKKYEIEKPADFEWAKKVPKDSY